MGNDLKWTSPTHQTCGDGRVGWNCFPRKNIHVVGCRYHEKLSDTQSGDDRRSILATEKAIDDFTNQVNDFASSEAVRKANAAVDESPWPAASGSLWRATARKSVESVLEERLRQRKMDHTRPMRDTLVQISALALMLVERLDDFTK